jgi:hypothetical protein
LWRTDLAYFWVINCEGRLQDDMHYHENDDHIFYSCCSKASAPSGRRTKNSF